MGSSAALSYQEPSIVTILITSSFLICLNVINYILDNVIYCGLVGQILIGVAWGLPGAAWLSIEVQNTAMQLGYLGLILIVYEGGLSTSIPALRSNLFLSVLVAFTGITGPIALSFILVKLLDVTILQAFAAGAALCSTSLGTTFTILSTSGLSESRLGVILSSAAMLDDVVGLIMVQVISNLSGPGTSFDAITVVRPILVSLGYATIVPLVCKFGMQPAYAIVRDYVTKRKSDREALHWIRSLQTAFVLHTLTLAGFVTSSTYAGTSNLFAAYLAGACISWFDSLAIGSTASGEKPDTANNGDASQQDISEPRSQSDHVTTTAQLSNTSTQTSGIHIYGRFFNPAVKSILKPLFFASIGFSIPITQMFSGAILWRGIVYTALMVFGKLLCGIWLVRPSASPRRSVIDRLRSKVRTSSPTPKKPQMASPSMPAATTPRSEQEAVNPLRAQEPDAGQRDRTTVPQPRSRTKINTNSNTSDRNRDSAAIPPPSSSPSTSPSLYPAAILASAMVARGEIGFLISGLAESKGVFSASSSATAAAGVGDGDTAPSELFLIVTWAVLLCTVLAPLVVGGLVRRVRRLRESVTRGDGGSVGDPLGEWGW